MGHLDRRERILDIHTEFILSQLAKLQYSGCIALSEAVDLNERANEDKHVHHAAG